MSKKIGLLAGVVLLASSMALAEPRILSASGIVRVIPTGGAEAMDAVPGMILAVGSEVKTGDNGRVTIEMGRGNSVRLRENGRITILEPKIRETRIMFIAGKLKGVFKHLVGGEKFSVEFSDNAVASVKGTEFGIEDQGGGVRINTFLGAVQFDRGGKAYFIPQGMGLTTAGPRVRLDVLGEAIIREWMQDSGDAGMTGSSDDLKAFAEDVKTIVAAAKDVITQMREDDFAAGRTLRDVHGNLTRVDQRIIRPSAREISFVNLCKREEYAYHGKFWNSNISGGARFDYLEAKIRFNADLPDSLLDWPGYFSANDNVEPDLMTVTMANGRPVGDTNRDTLVQKSVKTVVAGKDEWKDSFELNGKAIVSDSTVPGVDANGKETGDIWMTTEKTFVYDNGLGGGVANNGKAETGEQVAGNRVTLNTEVYAINNDGKILNINDFTNSTSMDPIGIMKNSAFEQVISATDNTGSPVMNRGNIDLVMTPDIVLAVVEKLSSQIATLSDGGM
jgi:hypothetical protein